MEFPSEGRGGWQQEPSAKLLQLHRHSLATLLVTGGQSEHRRAVAYAFHETGPLRDGPFVYVDCRRDELRLRAGLQSCFSRAAGDGVGNDVVLAAWGGTLYLDHVTVLRPSTQKLVVLALERAGRDGTDSWPLRLGAGDDHDLELAVRSGSFLPSLHDALDKIHVDLQAPVVAA
jgi:DNA-binding NtrC family response regulator